jgi:hypothetical protein
VRISGLTTTTNGFYGGIAFTNNAYTTARDAAIEAIHGSGAATTALVFKTQNAINALTEQVRIDQLGRVGIGTTSPGSFIGNVNLVVGSAATSSTTAGVTVYSGTATYGGLYFADGTVGDAAYRGAIEYSHDVDALKLYSAGTERARIDSSGRLLVGTSSSSSEAKLLVQGGSTGSGAALHLQRNVTTASEGSTIGYLRFANSADNAGATIIAEGDGTWTAGTSHPTRLVFSTTADGASSPTERMRITQSGEHAMFSNSGTFTVNAYNASAADTINVFFQGRHSATGVFSGTQSFVVYTNGNVQNTNGSYGTISDEKLKENIVDANSQWADLKAIKIRNWNFKEETGHGTHRQIGPIAQELEQICPGLVFETPDRDENGNETEEVTKGVNQSVLYMKAVKALQEAMERIETLEAKVAALEA